MSPLGRLTFYLLIKGEIIMTNNRAITIHRPSLLGRNVFDDVFDNFFTDFPRYLKQSTQGYPVVDIYRGDDGNTVMEFALAGFTRNELTIDVQPDKRSITVAADSGLEGGEESSRRIARRSFKKTYVNYDDNLDLSKISAKFENGLLSITVPQRPEAQPVSIEIE
jgi:HSP20 family protein